LSRRSNQSRRSLNLRRSNFGGRRRLSRRWGS
jgi:hypothetical protein